MESSYFLVFSINYLVTKSKLLPLHFPYNIQQADPSAVITGLEATGTIIASFQTLNTSPPLHTTSFKVNNLLCKTGHKNNL